MKKTVLKVLMVMLIISSFFSCKADEQTNFEIKFKEPDPCNMGDTIEIPLYIDKVNIPGELRGVLSFECDVTYDDTVMELLPYEKEENGQIKQVYIDANQDLLDYSTQIFFNKETNKLVFSLSTSYFQNVANSLTELTEIGKMKFRIKDGVSTGEYELITSGVTAGIINGDGYTTVISVKGIDDEAVHMEPEIDPSTESDAAIVRLRSNGIEVAVSISVSANGKKITIVPDEVNGSEIAYIVINDTRIDKKDGMFVFDCEPNSEYTINFYGIDGTFIANKFVTTYVDEESNGKSEELPKEEKTEENKKFTLKTGDYVIIAVGTVIAAGIIIALTVLKKKSDNNEEE